MLRVPENYVLFNDIICRLGDPPDGTTLWYLQHSTNGYAIFRFIEVTNGYYKLWWDRSFNTWAAECYRDGKWIVTIHCARAQNLVKSFFSYYDAA